ncbi:hypothetical protein F4802DRAFT_72724 [Xylaria palmicola]|nr:hypothetical protein F4802DRAFT_72724 [Xylaria palmicola]
MPSLTSRNPIWTLDVEALSNDDILGRLIEARHIVGMLQAELLRRENPTARDQLEHTVNRLESTAKRLDKLGLKEQEKSRLAELAKDREDHRTINPAIMSTPIATSWLMDQLASPEHTNLFYLTFSKSLVARMKVEERGMIIKTLCERQDLVFQYMPTPRNNKTVGLDRVFSGDDDINTMLKMLVLWGGKYVPWSLFKNMTGKSFIWGSNGEMLEIDAPLSPFRNPHMFHQHLIGLSRLGVVDICINSSLEESYTISTTAQQRIKALKIESGLKTAAVTILMHVFPKHRNLCPLAYMVVCKQLLPIFSHVIQYLNDETVLTSLTTIQITETIEACLSASYFNNTDWKRKMLSIIQLILTPFTYYLSKLMLRELVLLRISQQLPNDIADRLHVLAKLISTDKRSNACNGEVVMFQALLHQDQKDLQGALEILNSYQAQDENQASALEKIVLGEVYLRCGKLLRYQGHFAKSESYFVEFLGKPGTKLLGKLDTHLAAIQCELGRPEQAISGLEYELEELGHTKDSLNSRNAVRLRVTLGEAHVMAGLQLNSNTDYHFKSAFEIFQALNVILTNTQLARVGKINQFKVLVGIAIIFHSQGDIEKATNGWKKAQEAARNCGWEEGHSDMIANLSLSEISYRLGKNCEGDEYLSKAICLFQNAGHQYFFIGHGTLWLRKIISSLSFWFDSQSDKERGDMLLRFK